MTTYMSETLPINSATRNALWVYDAVVEPRFSGAPALVEVTRVLTKSGTHTARSFQARQPTGIRKGYPAPACTVTLLHPATPRNDCSATLVRIRRDDVPQGAVLNAVRIGVEPFEARVRLSRAVLRGGDEPITVLNSFAGRPSVGCESFYRNRRLL